MLALFVTRRTILRPTLAVRRVSGVDARALFDCERKLHQ